jgi:aspartyl protease family protein
MELSMHRLTEDHRRCSAAKILFAAMMALALTATAQERPRLIGLFQNQAIVELDGRQLVLKPGGVPKRGLKLLSSTAQEAVIEFNGEVATYRIGTQIGSNRASGSKGGRTVQIAPDAGGMYTVAGTINGFAVNFLVDTGASMVAMNKHTAKRLGINYRLDGTESVSQTASGFARTFKVTLAKVSVGEITLADVEGAVIDGDQPSEVLLGGSFLSRLDMQREGRLLILRKN